MYLNLDSTILFWENPKIFMKTLLYHKKATKGQLISKCLFGVIGWTKNQRKIGQKSWKKLRWFFVQTMTPKRHFEIN